MNLKYLGEFRSIGSVLNAVGRCFHKLTASTAASTKTGCPGGTSYLWMLIRSAINPLVVSEPQATP